VFLQVYEFALGAEICFYRTVPVRVRLSERVRSSRVRFCAGFGWILSFWLTLFSVQGQPVAFSLGQFNSTSNLLLHGAAAVQAGHLDLGATREFRAAGAWYQQRGFLEAGFSTAFAFQIPTGTREGFAFVMQNNVVPLLGVGGRGIGYEGIANSVAIEFDARRDSDHLDLTAGHISVHTRGIYANVASQTASLASTAAAVPELLDGNMHIATLHYRPGRLQVFIDATNAPRLELRCDLAKLINLDLGQAWIGFTADGALTNAQILNWSFVPAQGPALGLSSPANNGAFAFGAPIPLATTGAVARVDFFDGPWLLASDAAVPFAFSWTNAVPGTHFLTAVGYAADGRRSVGVPVRVVVNPVQPPIGINFARGGGGTNYSLGGLQVAGLAPQSQWNNVVPISTGNGSASNLRDANGTVTPVAVQFQFNGPGEEMGVDTTLSPDHQMMRAYLGNNALQSAPPSFAKVTNISFPAYDVIVYSDGDNRGTDRVTEFRIGSDSIFLRDQAYATFAGYFAEARGTAHQGLITTPGNYVRFCGLTNDNFTLDVFERSFTDVSRRAVVNAIQIVPAALPSAVRPVQVVRGPYLQSGASDGMTICWRTDLVTNSVVRYGTNPTNLTLSRSDPALVADHAIRITGLAADTRYYYALGASGTNFPASAEHYFVTSPTQTRPVRLWAIGDAGTADYSAASVRNAMLEYTRERKPDLLMLLGDNAYDHGSDSEYHGALFDMFAPVLGQTPLWSCMGNHETYTEGPPYLTIFNFPMNGQAGGVPSGSELYYSFDYANIHFVCLESTVADATPDAPMILWLREDLAANTRQWLIAYVHHPPHSKGSHDSDDEFEIEMFRVRTQILPVLEDYGVDLMLSGNSHGYERSLMMNGFYGTSDTFGPQYIVQGGSGRPDEAGAYLKPTVGVVPHSGTISIIAGNGGVLHANRGMHPVMVSALQKLGSMLIDIDGPNLEAKMIRDDGTVADYFTLRKGVPTNAFPEVSLSARTSSLSESASASPVFDITRAGPTNDALKVFYRISGSAENGRDFARLARTVTIPAGQQAISIPVAPIEDTEVEGPETFGVALERNTGPFRVVILPDTRAYIAQIKGGTPAMLEAQSRWIAAQADALNIVFALHTGDVTENNSAAEWALAQTHLQLPVPLAIAPGNHDGLNGPVAQTVLFNTYFPPAQARTRSEFGGLFETNKLDNAYYYFSGGGVDWLVLALEFIPRDIVLDWANRIVAANPQRKVIVLTHGFVAEDDTMPTVAESGRENAPAQIWEKLLRRHANIAFVFSGHTEGDGLGRRVDVGDYGNKVVQLSANFSGHLNGGNGYLRILEFDPAQDRLHVQTFSPYLNGSKTDPENQFDVPDLGLFKPWHGRYTINSVSNTATVTIQDNDVDTTRPTLVSAQAVGPGRQVVLTFSELVNQLSVSDVSNYSVSGFVVTNAMLLADGKSVVLTLASWLQDGASYSIRVSGIRDRAASPNIIQPNTTAVFTHRLVFLAETFDDRNFPGWQIVDEGTIDAPSIWSAPAGKLDQSSSIHGPDSSATDNRQGTYVYWTRPEALVWNNYIARATIRTPDEDAVGLLFWFQDPANYYKVELDRRNSFYRLLAVTSGFEILLAEESGTYALNSDLQLNVEAVDDRVYVALNGQPLFGGIVTNASSGSGTIGLYCWNNAGVTFDNVEVIPAPPNNPPTIALTTPAPDASFLPPVDITLSANAADADGIRQVEFFAGQELLGISHQPPYLLVWSNVPPGEYVLTAIARDNRGFSSVSTAVPIHVLLLDQGFESGSFAGWIIRDEGAIDAPSSWQVSTGKLAQLSNIYGPTSDAMSDRRGTFAVWDNSIAYRWRDYVLTATLASGDDDGIGVLFRYRDPNNYYKLEFDTQRNFRKLFRKLNGVETTLASEAGGCPLNSPFAIRVRVVDGQIEARMDNALL
jgi:calcineurin-like phosphoesterase family protein/Big-like domain-containing protein/purple acid phosphatase-like protein/lectin family protein/Calx-beta domain-containing protein